MAEREFIWEQRRIVACVGAELGLDINFQFGSVLELKGQLASLGKSDNRANKWPFFGLYTPFKTVTGGGDYDITTYSCFIANFTEPNKLSGQRMTDNFEPLLLPIYREYKRQMRRSQFFAIMDLQKDLPHTTIMHDFYGTEAGKNKAFADYVDGIELKDIQSKIAQKNCV